MDGEASGVSGVPVFDRIYRRNLWNGVESRSGPGSGSVPTQPVADWLARFVQERSVRSVLDIGCGDNWWMPDLPRYLGIDVSREAIRRAQRNRPGRRFRIHDATRGLPRGIWDLVIVRDVLQHLPLRDGMDLLGHVMKRRRTRFLLASTYTGASGYAARGVNVDITQGDCYTNDLTSAPFSLPAPSLTIPDGWDYRRAGVVRDPAKVLGLWELG